MTDSSKKSPPVVEVPIVEESKEAQNAVTPSPKNQPSIKKNNATFFSSAGESAWNFAKQHQFYIIGLSALALGLILLAASGGNIGLAITGVILVTASIYAIGRRCLSDTTTSCFSMK